MDVDVIIRTLAQDERRKSLLEALDSLTKQTVNARPIVVVNGRRFDTTVIDMLHGWKNCTVIQIGGNLQEAMQAGRSAVCSEYFAFLDDDDLYMPFGIDALTAELHREQRKDLIVGNGYVQRDGGGRVPVIQNIEATRQFPLKSLRSATWLYPSGAIFRSNSFTPDFFDDVPPLFEWTWIAYKSVMLRKLGFIDAFTYTYNLRPGSLSGTEDMVAYEDHFLQRLQDLPLPEDERWFLRRKHGQALHAIADYYLTKRDVRQAISYHLRSLLRPGGVRYLPYSRHILRAVVGPKSK